MKLQISILILALLAFIEAEDCNCRIKTENRIINGQFAVENSMPWMVSLAIIPGFHFCGGAILNERYILTAAHCVQKLFAFLIDVRVGIHNSLYKVPKEKVYSVKKIHSLKFTKSREPGDIAILELKKNITFIDGVVEKGCYNLDKREYPGELLAAGWGETEKMHKGLDTHKITTEGINHDLKQFFFKQTKPCQDFLICLKAVEEGDGICNGDSGSPLHYTENGITKIEGVTSFSTGGNKIINNKKYDCLEKAGYSRISYYADWISKTAEYNFCGAHQKP